MQFQFVINANGFEVISAYISVMWSLKYVMHYVS